MNRLSERNPGTVLTVTPNPALDETYQLRKLTPGSTHRVPPPLTRAGGKGLNSARVVHQVGFPALAIAPLGGPAGDSCRTELASAGVPHRLVDVSAPTRRSMAFVDEESGLTSIFNETGVPLLPEEWVDLLRVIEHEVPQAACVVGTGSLPPDAPADFFAGLVRLSSDAGLPCIVDTSGPALLEAAAAGAFLLKPNREELREATQCADTATGAELLLAAGAQNVLVSSGADGMCLFSAGTPGSCLAATLGRSLPGNPTGAGDAAVAALAVLLASGERAPEELLRAATAWSAAAVLMPAAGEISPRYAEFAAQVQINHITREKTRFQKETR
ncbi:hexose kinase [Arthrobacter gandavensis]|uniref:1-phosphofructokinase family hexose kinase n=1 Tax=Arthrobacter gandavensis TaxID=169960 RepID=UPI0018905594|nr:hexose kinase [Arthrobacter gandavensis]MBF4993415.1 hexose kinase [Arthrobacter gandavensis]